MQNYEVHYFDQSYRENQMQSGFIMEVQAGSSSDAIITALKQLIDYDEGTKGYEDYLAVEEVHASDEKSSCFATRISERTWEVHVFNADGVEVNYYRKTF